MNTIRLIAALVSALLPSSAAYYRAAPGETLDYLSIVRGYVIWTDR